MKNMVDKLESVISLKRLGCGPKKMKKGGGCGASVDVVRPAMANGFGN